MFGVGSFRTKKSILALVSKVRFRGAIPVTSISVAKRRVFSTVETSNQVPHNSPSFKTLQKDAGVLCAKNENLNEVVDSVDRLQIKVDFETDVGCRNGIQEVLSTWKVTRDSEIQDVSVISGGITNVLYRVDLAGDCGSYLFRIYGRNTEILIDRKRETKQSIEIGKQGFCPQILCVFENGRVEEFLEAKTLEPSDMGLREYQRDIAVQLSKMHKHLTLSSGDKEPGIRGFLEKFKGIVEHIEFENDPGKQELFSKFDFKTIFANMEEKLIFLEECYNNLGSKDLDSDPSENLTKYWVRELLLKSSVTHNDLLSGNILSTLETRRVVFIDFEYACYNYVGFDIANHFNEYAGFDCNFEKWYPSTAAQINFLEAYFSVPGVLPEGFPKDLKKSKVFWDNVIWWMDYFAYLDHYFWGLWAVCQSSISTVDFDYLSYANSRLVDGISFHTALIASRKGAGVVNVKSECAKLE